MKNIKYIYFVLFLSIVVAIVYLFFTTVKIQEKINSNVEAIFINNAKSYANNIDINLHHYIDNDPYKELKADKKLRLDLENTLSIISNDTFKYIFVLYKDKYGNYRYLLDGSKDKARFNQRLSVDKEQWNKVYMTKKAVLLHQKKLDELWLTYLKPVVFHNQTKAIIAIDFSTELPSDICEAVNPINQIFLYIFFAVLTLIFILLYQSFMSLKIKRESITDTLTQAYNRNYLRSFLNKTKIGKYHIMMLDIDFFKQVNDTYGHKAGDYILTESAKLVFDNIEKDDVFVRFGGEEFLLFVKKSTQNTQRGYEVAQKIRQQIATHEFYFEEHTIRVTVSIGLTCNPEKFEDISSAIKHADNMLYMAKNQGRNRVIKEPEI